MRKSFTLRVSGWLGVVAVSFGSGSFASADEPAGLAVKEVTVFKDGHALVLRKGMMPANEHGKVVIDDLPAPVLGTFWPFSGNEEVKLRAVTSGARRVGVERTALSIGELIEGNVGASVIIKDVSGVEHTGTIVGLPARSPEELKRTSPPGAPERLTEKGQVLLLKTEYETQVIPLGSIRDLAFKSEVQPNVRMEEMRNVLTLDLDWGKRESAGSADVGLMYLQKGLRWIPSYKVVIDGEGHAAVELQATLINELIDLDDVSMNLVIGVPSFAFKDTPDPMGLQAAIAQLGQYFQPNAQTGQSLSNAIMTQARYTERQFDNYAGPAGSGGAVEPDMGPEVAGTDRAEDIFVFHVEHFSLRKGERAVIPVKTFKLDYEDVYSLKLPITPPTDVRTNWNAQQQDEIERMLRQAKVQHVLRLKNTSDAPLTTAPAMIFKGAQVLAQGMMTYTAVGGNSDLPVTAAVDIRYSKAEKETKREQNAVQWNGHDFSRVDFEGTITLENFKSKPVNVEVMRSVLGNVGEVGQDGTQIMLNQFDDAQDHIDLDARPVWWYWYSWPYGWFHFNGMGAFSWNVTVEPGKTVELNYKWDYYWP